MHRVLGQFSKLRKFPIATRPTSLKGSLQLCVYKELLQMDFKNSLIKEKTGMYLCPVPVAYTNARKTIRMGDSTV